MARENKRRASLSSASRVVAGQKAWPGASKQRPFGVATRTKFVRYTTPS